MSKDIISKVVTFLPFPYYGGLQNFALELAKRIGTNIVTIGESLPEEIRKTLRNNLQIIEFTKDFNIFRNPIIVNPSTYLKIKRALDGYSLIHVHGPFPFTGDLILNTLPKNDYIFTYHFDIELRNVLANIIAKYYIKSLLIHILNKASIITVSSKYFAEESPVLKKLMNKTVIVPLGVDTEEITPNFTYEEKIIFIGRITPEKGVHVLLRAFSLFSKLRPKFELSIVGKPVNMKYFKHLQNMVRELGLTGKVCFHGFLQRTEMLKELSRSYVLVLPSLTRLDSFGIVLLEASSMAKPIIVSSIVPGARELVEKAGNGIIVKTGDPVALLNALLEINRKDPKDLGLKGRAYVEKNHDWRVVVRKILNIYEDYMKTLDFKK